MGALKTAHRRAHYSDNEETCLPLGSALSVFVCGERWPLLSAVADTNALIVAAAHKRRSSTATSAATSTTTANATTIPQMNGSAASAAPINTAAPRTKAIPARMKTTHVTSLHMMMGGRSTPRSSTLIPPAFLPLQGTLTCAAHSGHRARGRRFYKAQAGRPIERNFAMPDFVETTWASSSSHSPWERR
jgi:hypothetical protein